MKAQALFACTLLLASMTMLMPKAEASGPINGVYALSGSPSSPVGSLVADSAGNLYGTSELTDSGRGCGAVFKLTPQSSGGWQFTVIHTFSGNDGCQPVGGLIIDSVGNLYGTTTMGGAHGGGTVFALQPKATGWTRRVLYNFVPFSTSDVFAPYSSLTIDAAGNLYGTAASGGTAGTSSCGGSGCGGVFKITRSGAQFTETVLYNFTGGLDGGNPSSSLIFDTAGNLYGTTEFWGTGSGTVFELSPSTGSGWTETTLYAFTGGADGGMPAGGLVLDAAGNLYGMTNRAGDFSCNSSGCGTVFQLSPQENGTWALNVLLTFNGPNGAEPVSNLVFDTAGNLYGTATDGGNNNDGVVFRLSPSSAGWAQTFASFNGKDGALPYGPVLLNNGLLYGTATHGGNSNNGVIFSIRL